MAKILNVCLKYNRIIAVFNQEFFVPFENFNKKKIGLVMMKNRHLNYNTFAY